MTPPRTADPKSAKKAQGAKDAARKDIAGPTTGSRGTPHEILTPEGVPLTFVIASAGDRAAAFLIDVFLQFLVLVVLLIALTIAWSGGFRSGPGLGMAFGLVGLFLLRNFYFTWFELGRHAATPGKRRLGIRVMDANGGPLTAEAVIARNLTRELEIFLPIMILLAPGAVWPGAPGWAQAVAGLWALLFAFFPVFNRLRLRAGDLLAGTLVVEKPRTALLTDLGRTGSNQARSTTASAETRVELPTYVFTDAQLDVYGNYELQMLETVLRKGHDPEADRRTIETVAKKIAKKIRWEQELPAKSSETFLRTFYAALRARLEHRLLLGRGKSDKHAK